MKIAVVQHQLRATPAEDAAALLEAARTASAHGAELVFFPEVFSLDGDENPDCEGLFVELDTIDGERFIPQLGMADGGFAGVIEPSEGIEQLGKMALLIGDGCVDMSAIREIAMAFPDLAVFLPRSENELQAEAILELALALSDSLAGLVIVVEADGAEPGEPGHGGSAIIMFGKMVAEAMSGDDILYADIELPVGPPEPREPLPQMPTILQQRLAHHQGHQLEVDYPADLSDGSSQQ